MRMTLAYIGLVVAVLLINDLAGRGGDKENTVKQYNQLTPEESRIIDHRGTERPGTGEYLHNKAKGTYICRKCDAPLYRSVDKFDSGCGWPSFDDEIPGAVERRPDPDGRRVEIVCAHCGGHLGHVFTGERLTPKNTRHCVNSLSMKFVPDKEPGSAAVADGRQTAYFAAGCFWGVEYYFKKEPGVVSVASGYMGGDVDNPTYRQVSSGDTGHAEVVKVVFDPAKTNFEKLARLFFEIHDFTQVNRQGPDIGEQYRSEIFAIDQEQGKTAHKLLVELENRGHRPATRVSEAGTFWPAEEYHQDYYAKTGKTPYCHTRRNVF